MPGTSRFVQLGSRPTLTGITCSCTPNTNCATNPSTKVGTAITSSETIRKVVSIQVPLRRPEMTPARIPKIVSKTIAMSARRIVIGNASVSWLAIDWPRNVDPRSPWKMFARYRKYCTRNGLSRLNSSRRRICAASGSGLSPPSAAIGSPGMKNTRKYTRNVAPKKTGIIGNTRRSTYQVILALPMGRRGGGEDGRGPIRPRRVAGGDRGRRCCASPVPPGGSGQLADLVPDRLGVPAEDDVLDRVRVSGGHVAEPQRDRREILEQDLLRLLAEAERLLVLRRGQRLAQGLVELGVHVVAVVRPPPLRGRGGVQRRQEVEHRGVVGLPAGTEGSLHGPVGDLVPQRLEVGVGVAGRLDAEHVRDGVGQRVHPLLVTTVGVVGDGERALEGLDLLGLLPQLLRLGLVELEHLVARDGVRVAVHHRGGEVRHRLAGAGEDLLADLGAVDGVGDRLAAQGAGLTREVRILHVDRDGVVDRDRLVDRPVPELGLEARQGARRDLVDDVQAAGEQIVVRRLLVLVEDELEAVVGGRAGPRVVWVDLEDGVLVVVPFHQLVWTVADRRLAEGLRVVEESLEIGRAAWRGREWIGVRKQDGRNDAGWNRASEQIMIMRVTEVLVAEVHDV